MILDINKQLDEILKEELLQAEVITTECGKIMRFPNLDVPDVWEVFNNDGNRWHDYYTPIYSLCGMEYYVNSEGIQIIG